MQRHFPQLDAYLDEHDVDGYLIHESAEDANQRYLSGFGSPDSFASLWNDGALHLLVRGLDRGLARKETDARTVQSGAAFEYSDLIEEHGRTTAEYLLLARFLDAHDVNSVAVPWRFPLGIADGLREAGLTVEPEERDVIGELRAVKSAEEVAYIRQAQRATERAMERAEELLAGSNSDGGALVHQGEALTSERIKTEIELTLVRHGCVLEETIVACGQDAADPHERGSGPLAPNEPIVIDIFPRSRETKYHADMTRTFCVGEPSETAEEWYELTLRAKAAAFELLGPGVTGHAVHDAVCDVYEAAGIPTARENADTDTGFTHGTGHGVGLEIHEAPRLSRQGEELEPGHVVTVEPGVYDPAVGGIRVEDLVVITEDGFENLTDYHTRFRV